MAKIPVGLQLYTLRDEMANDFFGTLEQVAQMGYQGVEWAGFNGNSPQSLKQKCDELGIKTFGGHSGLDELENNPQGAIDAMLTLGSSFLTVPYLSEDRRQSADDYKKIAEALNRAGEKCKASGVQLCYHNHDFEFKQKFDRKSGFDMLFENTDPELVKAELDTFWVQYAGEDVVSTLKRLQNRAPLIHVKDMEAGESRSFAEFGEGVLDWESIFPACEEAGAQIYLIEQDSCKRPPLESVRISIDNAKARGML